MNAGAIGLDGMLRAGGCLLLRLTRRPGAVAAILIAGALASAHCGSGSTATLLGPTDSRCALTVNPATMTADAGGGSGSLTVTTSRECPWTAATTAPWIRLKDA